MRSGARRFFPTQFPNGKGVSWELQDITNSIVPGVSLGLFSVPRHCASTLDFHGLLSRDKKPCQIRRFVSIRWVTLDGIK
jgi:hypothetical protein